MSNQTSNVESIYPLSPAQLGMLVETLRAPESGVYSIQRVISFRGQLQPQAMREAWERVIQRHPPLRTLFVWREVEKPLQIVRRQVGVPWEYEDWRALSPGEQNARLNDLLAAQRRQGFDLSRAPLLRLRLIRLENDRHELIWHLHHLLLDGWSGYLVLEEVMHIYQGLCEGRSVPLASRRPYLDYVKWLQQQDMGAAKAFWQGALAGFTSPTPFGVDRLVTGQSSPVPGVREQDLDFPDEATDRFLAFCRKQNLTLGTLMHGTWGLLLSRYSGEDDVVFGSVVSGRPAGLEGAELMVGMFINTLPVRARFELASSASAWLKSFQSQLAEVRLITLRAWISGQAFCRSSPGM